ncbi:hypothetical protein XA68_14907 [Ophiocordyceps unilateralis]|uniref:Uncharacterized protein n=1 Tax=Ophiocordyceps unilateralis TaxID=268505 RepID=A0A2A9P943_OPHUN|nr:hypothetical protein XA68_14907 [Ophiocordyceps unilateralis]
MTMDMRSLVPICDDSPLLLPPGDHDSASRAGTMATDLSGPENNDCHAESSFGLRRFRCHDMGSPLGPESGENTTMTRRRKQLRFTSRIWRKRRQTRMGRTTETAYKGGGVSLPPFGDGRARRRWAQDSRNVGDSSVGCPRPVGGASPLLAMAATAVATEELDRLSLMARRADAEATVINAVTLEPPPRTFPKGGGRAGETGCVLRTSRTKAAHPSSTPTRVQGDSTREARGR